MTPKKFTVDTKWRVRPRAVGCMQCTHVIDVKVASNLRTQAHCRAGLPVHVR